MILEASDAQLVHDIANLREHCNQHPEDTASRQALFRAEVVWINAGLHAAGLPLRPVPTAQPHPPMFQRHPRKFAAPETNFMGEAHS
jgi:hypothetical protein